MKTVQLKCSETVKRSWNAFFLKCTYNLKNYSYNLLRLQWKHPLPWLANIFAYVMSITEWNSLENFFFCIFTITAELIVQSVDYIIIFTTIPVASKIAVLNCSQRQSCDHMMQRTFCNITDNFIITNTVKKINNRLVKKCKLSLIIKRVSKKIQKLNHR